MALASQSDLLDELMGKNRNLCGIGNNRPPHWSDEHLCKYFLCGFCPHDLFVNTKPDLGPCDKIHNERFRENYQKSDRFGKMGYEEDFYRYLCYLLEDVDKRIRRGHERLIANRATHNSDPDTMNDKHEKIEAITRKINDLVQQAEKLGTEGNVDQAQGVLKLCEQLRMDRSQLEGDNRPGSGQELEVCEICGAFRIKEDAPQRVEEHLSGKMHLGYAKIRDYVRDYKEKRLVLHTEKERDPRNVERGATGHLDRHHSRDRKTLRTSPKSQHRSRHGSSSNDRRRKTRSRSTSRKREDRHTHRSGHRHEKESRRKISPFSAARRAPEGADND